VALPSTRELAAQLGVSRGVITDAYDQLAAEGYIEQRPRHASLVRETRQARPPLPEPQQPPVAEQAATRWRYNLAGWTPDLSMFPRTAWARALRRTLQSMPDRDLDYGDPRGPAVFREAVCSYLTRTRGCDADPANVVSCLGYSGGLAFTCIALRESGVTTIAVEDPSRPEFVATVRATGLEPVAIPVDGDGLRVDLLAASHAQAVITSPAHQFPTGVVLSAARRQLLLEWALARQGFIVEDDYDAEYRYDREPVGALQGRMPDRVIYVGTASKTMAPALRIGWLHAPVSLSGTIAEAAWDLGWFASPIMLLAFADLLERGEIDRHLRRTRLIYRARRQRLIDELSKALPDVTIGGIAAGLHLTLDLPAGIDATAVAQTLTQQRVLIETLAASAVDRANALPGLVVGYSRLTEAQAPTVVGLLAQAIGAEEIAKVDPARHALPA
jgi:GntR family transcriptional regulator/MocR family aminotransferase